MTSEEKLVDDYGDDAYCGVDAASDKGYWLEEATEITSDNLISWREEVGLSPESLSKLAPIPLEHYLLIEKGERTMTNGDAWRIDAAITKYEVSKWTWFEKTWRLGWPTYYRYRLRMIWRSNTSSSIITISILVIMYFGLSGSSFSGTAYVFGLFLGSAMKVGLPACLAVWLILYIDKELRDHD